MLLQHLATDGTLMAWKLPVIVIILSGVVRSDSAGYLSNVERPTVLDNRRQRANCVCSRCWWGLLGYFSLAYHSSFLIISPWDTFQRTVKPEITNQNHLILTAVLYAFQGGLHLVKVIILT